MCDRPIAAFDIETIPDPDIGRRVFGRSGDDSAVVHEMGLLRDDSARVGAAAVGFVEVGGSGE